MTVTNSGYSVEMKFLTLKQQKWASVAMAMLMALLCGTMYAFSAFSTQLKDVMSWQQSQVELMGVAMHWGVYMCKPFCGFILDRYGTFVSCTAAALMAVCGYGVIAIGVDSIIPAPVPLMVLCFLLVGTASAQAYVTALYVSISNFAPSSRGKIVGVIASMFGLSATFVSLVYANGFGGDSSGSLAGFFGFFAVIMFAVFGMGAVLLRKVEAEEEDDLHEKAEVALQGFDATDDDFEDLPIKAMDHGNEAEDVGLFAGVAANQGGVRSIPQILKGEPLNLFEASRWLFQDRAYVCVWLQFSISAGTGLYVITNLGSLYQSLHGGVQDNSAVEKLVIALSICNMSGRLIAGGLLDAGLTPMRLICGLTAGLSLAALGMAFYPTGSFYWLLLTAVGAGLGYGGLWSVCPAMLAERYGTANFGKVFGLMTTAPAITSFIFNEGIAASVYESHIHGEGSDVCVGSSCFYASSLIIGGLGLASSVAPLFIEAEWAVG